MSDENTTSNEDVTGLKANNADLKQRLTKEQNKTKSLEERILAIETERDEAREAGKSDADKATSALQKQIEQLNKKLVDSEAREATFRIDGAISDAIAKAGVLPHFVPAVTAMLKSGVEMKNGEAFADGSPLADKISGFFGSDDARHYVAAPANSGGGAQGSGSKALAHDFTAENFDSRQFEWLALAGKDPAHAKAIAQSVGKGHLAEGL